MGHRPLVNFVPLILAVKVTKDASIQIIWLGGHNHNAGWTNLKKAAEKLRERGKITSSVVAEISALGGLKTTSEIGQIYGLSSQRISEILRGVAHVTPILFNSQRWAILSAGKSRRS
jgi:hypothetical protein